MLKRFTAIIGVVLLANVIALVSVRQNARGQADAVVTLTEREARLTATTTDNTGMTLWLQFERDPGGARWFDRSKLASIGFDCSVDPNAANAIRHYDFATLPRQAYVVLEYDPRWPPVSPATEAERTLPGPQSAAQGPPEYRPRLRPVDTGTDATALRARYSDRRRYIITAGVVRAWLHRPAPQDRFRLDGSVVQVLPTEVYVPREMQATIRAAAGTNDNWDRPLNHQPRYEVTLEYGSSLLPRVVSVKQLTDSSQ
jgi:hypothetical protein